MGFIMEYLLIKNGFLSIRNWWRGFACLAFFSSIYLGLLLFYEVNDEINIGKYANSGFDYIFQAISDEQITVYSEESSVEKISPFKSFSGMEIRTENHSCVEVGILAFDNLSEDVNNTFFSDNRAINVANGLSENGIYIDNDIAESLNVSVGDSVEILWGSMGNEVLYTIDGIYNPTTYIDKHTAMINWDSRVMALTEEIYGNDEWYSAAFVSVNDVSSFEQYITDNPYIPSQYIKDMTEGMSKEESDEITNNIMMQNWNELILKRTETVESYNVVSYRGERSKG